MANYLILDGQALCELLRTLALATGEIARPNVILIHRLQRLYRRDNENHSRVEYRHFLIFRVQDHNERILAEIEVLARTSAAAAASFSTPAGSLEDLYQTLRRTLAGGAATPVLLNLISPELGIAVVGGPFPHHLVVVSLVVGPIGLAIPHMVRVQNGLSPRIGIGATQLLAHFRDMSVCFRDEQGDRYRLGLSDPALQLRVASNGYQVTFALDHVVRTLWLGARQFIPASRAGERAHTWITTFNFQSFYRVVLHATQLSLSHPSRCVWIAREAIWVELDSSKGSFFLYARP